MDRSVFLHIFAVGVSIRNWQWSVFISYMSFLNGCANCKYNLYLGLGPWKWLDPVKFGRGVFAGPGVWKIVYMCGNGIGLVSFYKFRLDFETVQKVCILVVSFFYPKSSIFFKGKKSPIIPYFSCTQNHSVNKIQYGTKTRLSYFI